MSMELRTPQEIVAAYDAGLPGWRFDPDSMDRLMSDRKAVLFEDAAPHLVGIGRGKMALLWRSREKFDPGAFGQEPQTRGSCVAHGSRNARDTTRSVEIHIHGELEEYYLRGAIEPTYAARGHRGEGMDPAVAARFETDVGFLFRKSYPFADLARLNERIAEARLLTEEVRAECRRHNVGRWVAPTTADQVKDLLQAGYALHSGQSFGVRATSDDRGIAVPSGRWNHDMATVGYDDTREVYPVGVFLIVNSWGAWNQRPRVWPEDRYGPWPPGSFWVAEDVYARAFVGSRSIFAYADVAGVPAKNLPDYGNLSHVMG